MQRKTVTVLFCDVTGSTSLGESIDPEALRALLAHYFERMRAIVERHEGTVEKFIGDAVMAVFGVPSAREAVEIAETTEDLGSKAETRADLGEVLTLAGRPQDAADALEQALVRFEAKENLVMAARMRERLAALRAEVG